LASVDDDAVIVFPFAGPTELAVTNKTRASHERRSYRHI
jgi:hypothetical protein